jgi:hypothetical protein
VRPGFESACGRQARDLRVMKPVHWQTNATCFRMADTVGVDAQYNSDNRIGSSQLSLLHNP